MSATPKDGGPAFPSFTAHVTIDGRILQTSGYAPGISLRDYFAAAALTGLLAGAKDRDLLYLQKQKNPGLALAESAYDIANAMLATRERKEGN